MNALSELDLFVAVCRNLSFKDAAASLGMPASTLSRRIAQFERDLAVQLFVRTTRRVELTAAAKLYLSRCEAIVDAARDARSEVQGMVQAPAGRLRVSMEADVASLLLAPAIAKMHRQYPQINLDIDLSPASRGSDRRRFRRGGSDRRTSRFDADRARGDQTAGRPVCVKELSPPAGRAAYTCGPVSALAASLAPSA